MENCLICGDYIDIVCYKNTCIQTLNSVYVENEPTICNYLYTKKRDEEFMFILKLIKKSLEKYNIVETFEITNNENIPNLDIISNANSDNINLTNIKKLISNSNIYNINDSVEFKDIEKLFYSELGSDNYGLVKFLLKKSEISINYDKEVSEYVKIRGVYKVDALDNMSKEDTIYLYHGSLIQNWFSIIHNGLQIFSNTKRMKNGSAYGSGIYLSNLTSMSSGYSINYGEGDKNDYIMGVFEVKNYKKYKKTANIYVVNNIEDIKIKYIFNLSNISEKCIAEIGLYFTKSKKKIESNVNNYLSKMKNKRLLMEYSKIMKNNKNIEFIVEDTENLEKWTVKLVNIDEESNLSKDMKKLDIDCIELEIKFESYPIKPPVVRIIKPSFVPMTGHITQGGAICFELLTNQGWTPAILMENLLIHIKAIISEDGRLNAKDNREYTENNASAGRTRFMKAHNWS